MKAHGDVFLIEVLDLLTQVLSPQGVTHEELESWIVSPPEFSLGQASLPCYPLAKKLRLSPPQIAKSLVDQLASPASSVVSRVEAIGDYLNFHCDLAAYGAWLLPSIQSGSFFAAQSPVRKEKIVVEFSQPNTHKALHVGHLRNMVYGEAVCRLLEYAGHEVVRATYPGDLGTHIAKALWYIVTQKGSKLPQSGQADWLGQMYAESNAYLKSKEGSAEEPEIRAEIGRVLLELQEKGGTYHDLYLETREWSLAQMREVYAWLGISFDEWYFESECDAPSRELVLRKFEEGFFVRSEGAIGIDLSEHGLGFALFLKSDGNGLYLTKDLELLRRKFEDPAVTRSIAIVDSRQKHHFKQLFKTAERMGYPQAALSTHLSYETVTTEDGRPFSSRSCTGMSLGELRGVLERKVVDDYLAADQGSWTSEEIASTAQAVALGALKYGFLKVDGDSVIRFSLNDWLRLDGDTGPYLQYTHARCVSLIEKAGTQATSPEKPAIEASIEKELLHFLGRFNGHALQSAETHRPSVMAGYLYDLAKLFNRFYRDCPILAAPEPQRGSRLALARATALALRQGLGLLGIPAPNRM